VSTRRPGECRLRTERADYCKTKNGPETLRRSRAFFVRSHSVKQLADSFSLFLRMPRASSRILPLEIRCGKSPLRTYKFQTCSLCAISAICSAFCISTFAFWELPRLLPRPAFGINNTSSLHGFDQLWSPLFLGSWGLPEKVSCETFFPGRRWPQPCRRSGKISRPPTCTLPLVLGASRDGWPTGT
jgi:hypothetical protein